MRIIEIKALENGAHDQQEIDGANPSTFPIPEGWAVIPDDMPVPGTFPFVNITVKDGVVTSMTAGTIPEPEPKPEPEPTVDDRMTALENAIAEGLMLYEEDLGNG